MLWNDRIFGVDYATHIYLQETPGGLELTTDVGDQETTVRLEASGVRNLRLALARYERKVLSDQETTRLDALDREDEQARQRLAAARNERASK